MDSFRPLSVSNIHYNDCERLVIRKFENVSCFSPRVSKSEDQRVCEEFYTLIHHHHRQAIAFDQDQLNH